MNKTVYPRQDQSPLCIGHPETDYPPTFYVGQRLGVILSTEEVTEIIFDELARQGMVDETQFKAFLAGRRDAIEHGNLKFLAEDLEPYLKVFVWSICEAERKHRDEQKLRLSEGE